ncbi:MAG: phosphodiester glycosidase family protein [Myxococcota bacterium]
MDALSGAGTGAGPQPSEDGEAGAETAMASTDDGPGDDGPGDDGPGDDGPGDDGPGDDGPGDDGPGGDGPGDDGPGDDGPGDDGPATECDPGETMTVACNAAGNDIVHTCNGDGVFEPTGTIYGCTVQLDPGAGTRVCPGETFTRSCWPIAGGRARVDWECDGTTDPAGGGFTQVDEDYCTAVSGPEAGLHFCPGEVILRDNCPAARDYYICPDTQGIDVAFESEAVLSCDVEALEWEPLHRGVALRRWTSGGDRFRAVRIDLCDVSLRMAATESGDRGQRTSQWASGQGMLAAINGGFYLSGYAPDGCVAFGGGQEWGDSADTNYRSFIALGPQQIDISPPGAVETPPYPGFGFMEEAVCGDAVIVEGGAAQVTGATSPRARSGAGFSEDGQTLYLLTVDEVGGSSGMTVNEFGPVLASLGVHTGINLDGGGSTSMYATGLGLVNNPSDGAERIVANHLGVYIEGGAQGYNCVE